jgi:uncharacterized protein (TIGR03437 family)
MITIMGKVLAFGALTGVMFGQVLSNSSLTGKYFVRHIQFTTDANNNATDARSITGAITFDGQGNYSFTGQQVIGAANTANYTVGGTYSVNAAGTVSLTNPQTSTLTVNARYGAEAVIGSSTEASGNTFDLFVAIPAPPSGATYSNSTLSVSYVLADLELTAASTAQVRNSIGGIQFNGTGAASLTKLLGHGASIGGGATQQDSSYSGTYSVNHDGTGTITFQSSSGALLSTAPRNLAVSASTNIFLASTPGAHDILIGLQSSGAENITIANFTGRYWVSGIETDLGGGSSSEVGSATVIASDSAAIIAEREHQSGSPSHFDGTSGLYYAAGTAKTGNVLISAGSTIITLGNNSTLLAADIGTDLANSQPSGQNQFAITLGVRVPTETGSGVFVNPQGIINAAGNAPVGNPISPGEFIAIYGSGLATQTLTATPPYPATLGGVGVSIGGFPAPIYLVSATQINCLVPYEVSTAGGSTTITVTSGSATSNTVTAPIAPTSPGVFSLDFSGAGSGAVTHNSNGALVGASNPAVAGEVLVVYLTGLGALQTPITDGQAPNPEGPDSAVATVQVQVDGVPAPNIYYAGINPVYPGLYQIDFTMPQVPDHGQQVNLLIVAGNAGTQEVTLFAQ